MTAKKSVVLRFTLLFALLAFHGDKAHAAVEEQYDLAGIVNAVILPLMAENDIPGMAVAISIRGERHIFNYGLASKESRQEVREDTLFEIGSISKTFTATLAGYAQAKKDLSLSDTVSQHLPELKGGCFDAISLLDLAAYTAGGLPLQFPDSVKDARTMIAYFKNWRPAYAAGTQRLYSNPSIGLLGYVTAKSMGESFENLMEKTLFPKLGLTNTFIKVPEDMMRNYAFGYSKSGKPVRVRPGVLAPEAYGVKTSASDLARFLEANMNSAGLEAAMQEAIAATHAGYFQIGGMTQGLGWEMYACPADLDSLMAGASPAMSFAPNKAARLSPPLAPKADALLNKTGSTNGFGAYAAFIPAEKVGIVMLANKNYPNAARVKAARRMLSALRAGGCF